MNAPAGTASDFFLDPTSFETLCTPGNFSRGLDVLRRQQVLACELVRSNSREWAVEGQVAGSRSEAYNVSATLEVSPSGEVSYFSAQCDCPAARNCKHSIALCLRASYKSAAVRNAQAKRAGGAERSPAQPALHSLPALPSSPPVELAASGAAQALADPSTLPAERRVAQWLDLFGSPVSPSAPVAETARPAELDADEQIVYLLSPAQQGGHAVLQLGYGLSRRLKNGRWSKPRVMQGAARLEALPDDLQIVQLIQTLSARSYSYPYSEHFGLITGETGTLALALAEATGRLYAQPAAHESGLLGPVLRLGAPQIVRWRWTEALLAKGVRTRTAAGSEPVWSMTPALPEGIKGARCFANQPPLYLHEGAGVCGVLEMPGVSPDHLALLIKAPPIAQSALAEADATLLRELAGLPLPTRAQPPEVLRGSRPIWRLSISPVALDAQPRLGLMRATLQFDYAGLQHYALHESNPVLIEQAAPALPADAGQDHAASIQRIELFRDLQAERAAHTALHVLGLAGDSAGQFYLPFVGTAEQSAWLAWLDDDFAAFRSAGFAVTADASLDRWIARADDLQVAMTAVGAQDGVVVVADSVAASGSHRAAEPFAEGGDDSQSAWFDLSLGMSIAGQRQNILPLLPELLAQLAGVTRRSAGHPGAELTLQLPDYIYLKQDDGSYLRLPCEPLRPWLQALLDLVGERSAAKSGDFKGAALRLSRLEALRMGGALGQGATWQGARQLRRMIELLGGRAQLPPVVAPDGLAAQLRPYQLHGLQWLQFLRANQLGGILADDMGLGKTLQTLAHVLTEKQAGRLDLPALVIAPVSLMGNWRSEAARFTPQLRTLVLHGAGRHDAAADMASYDLVIAPYSLLQRDRERWQAQRWHLVVLDEAQNIKNANSHAAQVVSELDTRHRLCLSGTPMENHLGELWSLFHFLMPGFLGSQARFKSLYRTPIEKHGDSERASQLRQRVTPFMLRRHKRDVATDLPEKQVSVCSVALGDQQADLYETIRLSTEKAVRDALASKGLGQSHIQILDALLKLRQVCCDPRLVAVPAAQNVRQSAKLDLLMELLPELLAEGRKVLLFSQFTSMLALIEEELARRQMSWVKLTGQSQKRDQIIERFTSGEVPLFLISLKAGGVGLNLTQADTVIHYDPWWNPAAETQATDRAHRIGQTQRVMVYKLVAEGTIEERILALQERKAALAESMYSGAAERKEALFTESDLAALLRPLGS